MKRHEMWREEYRSRPYLQHLSDAKLNCRHDDVAANYVGLASDGRIGVLPPDAGGDYWGRLYTHVLEEMGNRGMRPDHTRVEDSHLPEGADQVAAARLREVEVPDEPYLVKYGQTRHLRPLLDNGKLRIAPATDFADPSLNPAKQDEELRINTVALPDELEITLPDGSALQPVGNVNITWSASTNYYVWCLSSVLNPRLFRQFEYNACLLIPDPHAFLERVTEGLSGELPTYSVLAAPVIYIDPMNPPEDEPNVYFSKSFRYAYQKEVRVVAVPPEDREDLDPVHLELGRLQERAELIEVARNGEGRG